MICYIVDNRVDTVWFKTTYFRPRHCQTTVNVSSVF